MTISRGEEYFKLSAQIGWQGLVTDIDRDAASGTLRFTQLVVPYVDESPDDAFSRVPYDKVRFIYK